MKIQQIRNATLIISYGGLKFLVDPWLQDKNKGFSAQSLDPIKNDMKSPLHDLPFSPEDILMDIDYCLVTHFHEDHFTKDYLPLDISIIFQNEEDETKAKEIGFTNTSSFIENSLEIDGITLIKVPGVHGDNEITSLKMGVVSGYVFQHPDEKTVYIAGDTIYYYGVENNIKTYQPDIIIVNSCDARLTFGRLIMNKEDVVSVCKAAQNAKVIASHMDNVNHGFLTREELKQYLIDQKYDKQVIIPNDGEIIQESSI
ncbi:MBL fold metallo-hydrolase [Clostridium estertheticum]|uniref:MBL fold metallo-hydrolase n=1 Tax=Clostridium estertheticum subsp. estertheticum TaxID=1552 RepID=A0A1J0GKH8_9CLOT|nr:MBL fold metallo-hydrolase [Clostridium estertheticum]APC41390.1 hypothetical protein A7L45_15555 [Clostridium estertheticum subsp. estertheticum]MBZ9616718.1 MBL fold metallo-hydrolase [Clostridium estertheticum subsp. laramiense]WAG72432.1 MBL fold metallo-hydrolase [Clostridium estertheticum]